MKGEKPYVCICVSMYIQAAVVIKTQLEVPDDRLCNAVMLSDCATQIMQFIFVARPGQSVTT